MDWHLLPGLSVTSVVMEGCLSSIMGPVTDCVEVGLGGRASNGDVCTDICGWCCSKPVSKV